MNWFKKHVDTVIVLSGILISVFWMNSSINNIEKEMGKMSVQMQSMQIFMGDINKEMSEIKNNVNSLEREVSIIKTVLIMQKIIPNELATIQEKQ